ncbi:MAG TPA: acyl-CoA dehydrogenase family protein [Candidatus Binatia bacterium]|nr:acyl-CoA dehydrogenase family protein [Candidatus Binatia bacterium]
MNFDFSDDQKLLQKTARDYLAEHAPLSVCRAVLESDASYSEMLWKGVAELGWLGTAIPEQYGGSGFGRLELAVMAEEVGRALAPIPFSSSVYLATEAILRFGSEAQKQELLPKLASGERLGAFAHAERPGEHGPEGVGTKLTKGKLSGTKVPVADGDSAHFALVTARSGKEVGLALVDLTGDGVSRTRVRSIDPSRSLASIQFNGAPAQWLGTAKSWDEIQHVLDRAAVLMAFEQLGGAQRAFDITREFCLGRYAFGRPVASFQAIKHRLADLYVEIELARSNAYYGAWALSNESPELGRAAAGARAAASDAFELASKEMIQMHGGVGYTWEYDCHLFYRRAKWLAVALGSTHQWREQLIQRLEA